MKRIVLTTLNARYSHTSLGLRYLLANLKELQNDATIVEFVINENIQSIAEKILELQPMVVGIGVYIWNATDTKELIEIIKKVSPATTVVIGGPEAGHMPLRVNFDRADYIIQGEGEVAFFELCKAVLDGDSPKNRIIKAAPLNLKEISLPYAFYSDHDIENRYVYVEASRGCPFLCEFCLSAIDEKMRYFDIEMLIEAFEALWRRGARSFKFIDRTFNLNIRFANRLLAFFLSKTPPYFAHFEVIPDHFPDSLKSKISQFPPASLQLEIGIQTLNPEVAKNINRPLGIGKINENIAFLENRTRVHMHLDLIVGLPGESLESFGKNLDRLCSITTSEIQIGILKKLSGTTLYRHDDPFGMVYSDLPPYDILQNNLISFQQMQKMKRFARFWDLTYNSGNFSKTVKLLWGEGSVFEAFYDFSDWIYHQTQSTWKISLERLSRLLYDYLVDESGRDSKTVAAIMLEDITKVAGRTVPGFLKGEISKKPQEKRDAALSNRRQLKHL